MKYKNRDISSKIEYFITAVLVVWFGYFVYQYYTDREISSLAQEQSGIEFLPPPNASDHYKWKNDETPYTIVNYFSMDCPHCKELDAIEEKNRIAYEKAFSLIYRHSPLAIQPLSGEKAVIAECVYNQLGDEEMFKFISDSYVHYEAFSRNNVWIQNLAKKYSKNISLLEGCFSGEEMKGFINDKKNEAASYGVRGTPTIAVFKEGVLLLRLDTVGENSVRRVMDYLVDRKN